MSEVGKITVESRVLTGHISRHIHATVNVGGSLVVVDAETDGDVELESLVHQLDARLSALAVERIQASLRDE